MTLSVNAHLSQTHERRSWHYPPPWDGVRWMPARTPLRDLAARAWQGVVLLTYMASWVLALGGVLTSVAAAAVMIGAA